MIKQKKVIECQIMNVQFVLTNINDEYHSNNECPICFNTISKEQLYITNYNHVFCKSC